MKKFISAAILGVLALAGQTEAQARTYIRYEAHSPGGQKALASMQKAVEILKQRGCTDPVSWYYQGAMHWTPDVSRGTNLETNPLCPSYTKSTPTLMDGWNNCASHNKDQDSKPSGRHFLPWHRLYLVYFEKMIREVSGDPDFALPYWGYGDPALNALPAAFQAEAGGSLYEASRRASLNDGKPIHEQTQNKIVQYLDDLGEVRDDLTFNDQLNKGLHGRMHDYIGGKNGLFNPVYNAVVTKEIYNCVGCGLMAIVPSAGFDPIFWLHHSNVDRLWQNFVNREKSGMVTLDQLKSERWPYHFFQAIKLPNGDFSSRHVHLDMEDVEKAVSAVDYVYDDAVVNLAQPKAARPVLVGKESILAATQPQLTVAETPVPQQLRISLPSAKRSQLLDSRKRAQTLLQINVSYRQSPNVRYDLYVNLPKGVAAGSPEAQKFYAGQISFFVNDPTGQGGTDNFRFDITDELAAAGAGAQNVLLSIVKADDSDAGSITVHKASVVRLQ